MSKRFLLRGILLIGCVLIASCSPNSPMSQPSHTPLPLALAETSHAPTAVLPSPTTDGMETLPAPALFSPTAAQSESSKSTAQAQIASPTATQQATNPPVNPVNEPTREAALAADDWKDFPILPELSPRMIAIINDGLAKGNNPNVFSKIGDCESRTTWFLGDFDLGPQNYALGPYESELSPVIDYYQGSFNRLSLAAKPGFSSASVMGPIWADKQSCQKNESPLACEYRINKPIMAFIMLGTNDASNPKTFEGHMRKIIEFSLSQGVLPLLGTKADNVEGNHSINQDIARLAYQYDIPLWNYWRAAQSLPNHGLQPDGLHLTFGPTQFDSQENLKNAWPIRNLNAMQILIEVMEETQLK